MITVRIDRSTIRRNPNAGRTEIQIPGRSYIENGKRITQLQTVRLMTPEPSFFYEHNKTNVKCSRCMKSFGYSELEEYADDDTYVSSREARICPRCGEWECCDEIEYEKLTDEMIAQALKEKIPAEEDKLLAGLASGELRVVAGKVLHIDEVMHNIRVSVEEMDGDDVARAHNSICAKKIRYLEDSEWELTGEDDND